MKDFIEITDVNMWDIVKFGCEPHMILLKGVSQPKVNSLWTNEEKKSCLKSQVDYF